MVFMVLAGSPARASLRNAVPSAPADPATGLRPDSVAAMAGRVGASSLHRFDGTTRSAEPAAAPQHGPAASSTSTHGETMNKNQVKGTLKDAAGKVQEATGKVIDSHEQQLKGIKKQVEGQAQKAVGDIQEVVKDASKR
jgi:uncharacterized protein YjbJ (UPF0337 family)